MAEEAVPDSRPAGRLRSRWGALAGRPSAVPLLVVTAAVVAANLPYLTGLFDPNPMYWTSGLTVSAGKGVLGGLSQIDPNTGFTSQAFGHLAALDWLHGRVPWWNPYEGIGAPLAGEMQGAALFLPFVLLDVFANGQIYVHLILELVAGYSTWFLLRRFVRSRAAATAGAVAFALNGTFAWLFHAPGNPVAFAPLLLLGIEQCLDGGPARGLRGWPTVALAVALSVYAGFPEVAYIDGLLAVLWLALRLSTRRGTERWTGLARAGGGAAAGLLLAAPALAAFGAYVQQGGVDQHAKGYAGQWLNAGLALPATFMPYVFGPIFGVAGHNGEVHRFWSFVGGYLGLSVVVLALVGVTGREHRRLRIGLAVWVVLGMGRAVGVPVAMQIVDAIPAVSRTVFFRYGDPSWSLAVAVLAAMGVDDLAADRRLRRLLAAGGLAGAGVVAGGVEAVRVLRSVSGEEHKGLWSGSSMAWAAAVTLACVLIGVLPHARARRVGLAAMVVMESVALFIVPELAAPRHFIMDAGPVHYLQAHLGTGRFLTVGPIAPNYGSYWEIGEADINDNPIPKSYAAFIVDHLDHNTSPYYFTGTNRLDRDGPSAVEEMAAHLSAYESIGVSFLVAPRATRLPPTLQLQTAYSDPWVTIYRLPDPAPLYSASAGCRVVSASVGSAEAVCDRAGSLVRRELYMPGWSASDGGRQERVGRSGPLFQSVALHEGVNRLAFSYRPPRGTAAVVAAVLALSLLAGAVVSRVLPVSRERPTPTTRRGVPRRCSAPSVKS